MGVGLEPVWPSSAVIRAIGSAVSCLRHARAAVSPANTKPQISTLDTHPQSHIDGSLPLTPVLVCSDWVVLSGDFDGAPILAPNCPILVCKYQSDVSLLQAHTQRGVTSSAWKPFSPDWRVYSTC